MTLVAGVANAVDNETTSPDIVASLRAREEELRRSWTYPNAQSHPRVAAWRNAFKRLPVSGKDFPSSVEALCRRVLSNKPLADINPVVNLYNLISLTHVVPVGGWDIDRLARGTIDLRLSRKGEPFREMGAQASVEVDAGEVSYCDAAEIVTRHFVWRQSEAGKLTPQSRSIFFVSEILGDVGRSAAEEVERSLVDGLAAYFGVTLQTTLLTAP